MSNSSCRRSVLTLAFASTLVAVQAAPVRADDEGAAPRAPPNVPASDVPTSDEKLGQGGAGPDFTESSTAGSVAEPTFETETRTLSWPNVPLLATGSAVFAASYLPAVVGGAVSDRGDDDLYIPVAGPWMMLAGDSDEKRGYKALLVVDGLAQGIGALMFLTAFMIPERVTERWYLIGSNDLRLAPSHVGTGYGLGAMGRF